MCTLLPIVVKGVRRSRVFPTVQQIATDHGAGASFAGLAVYRGDIALVLFQPIVNVYTESLNQFDARWIMVLEWKILNSVVKFTVIVSSLRAKIVYFIVAIVSAVQQLGHFVDVIAIEAFEIFGWKAHRYHLVAYIRQVQIVAVLGEALLLLADNALNRSGNS